MTPSDPVSTTRREDLESLCERLGVRVSPEKLPLLHMALMHRSWRAENDTDVDNERLEFLGDAVIGLATAQFLFRDRPEADEGEMSQLRAAIVSRQLLGRIGESLGLGHLLLLGVGEESTGGRQRTSNLGSTLEAICGALSLAMTWEDLLPVLERIVVRPGLALAEAERHADHKSLLQEWTQRHFQVVPSYSVVSSGGPDHKKEFVVVVRLEGLAWAEGRGARKKWAENDAARAALARIERRQLPEGIPPPPQWESNPPSQTPDEESS